jgi:hypothetical protein
MKLDIWIDGSMEIMHTFSFLPMLKILVAMATNRLKIWQNFTHKLDPVITQKVLEIFL